MPTFHSIYYPIAIDQGQGALKEESDYAQHVQQMMLQILFTNPGERINRPDFGCGLRRMVFAPNSTQAASLLQVMIYQAMQKWLNNVISVTGVQVTADDEKLEVSIQYALLIQPGKQYLNVQVTL